jgi:hypothetical protein
VDTDLLRGALGPFVEYVAGIRRDVVDGVDGIGPWVSGDGRGEFDAVVAGFGGQVGPLVGELFAAVGGLGDGDGEAEGRLKAMLEEVERVNTQADPFRPAR